MNLSSISSVLQKVSPEKMGVFLSKNGYRMDGQDRGRRAVYVNESSEMILLPLDQNADDYSRRLMDIVEIFANEKSPPDDIVAKIVLPNSDVLRYRVQTPESAWGHLRLQYSQDAMAALYSLLKFTAAGVSTAKREYKRVSESAKLFSRQCNFGQTEYGSFVLKVFCPINPIGVSLDEGSEPYGRRATRALLENLDFLSSDNAEDPEEPLPPTLNRQVATSVGKLRPASELGTETEVQMKFSSFGHGDALRESLVPAEEISSINLSPFAFSRASAVSERLKKAEEFESERLRGFIETLHKDRPIKDTEQSHEVTISVKYGSSRRLLRARLLPDQYRDAMVWHDNNIHVDIDAVIDKRGKTWSVHQLNSLSAVERGLGGARLF